MVPICGSAGHLHRRATKGPKRMELLAGCTLLPDVQYHRFVAGDYDRLSGTVV
jgi:hypothetical protein